MLSLLDGGLFVSNVRVSGGSCGAVGFGRDLMGLKLDVAVYGIHFCLEYDKCQVNFGLLTGRRRRLFHANFFSFL